MCKKNVSEREAKRMNASKLRKNRPIMVYESLALLVKCSHWLLVLLQVGKWHLERLQLFINAL